VGNNRRVHRASWLSDIRGDVVAAQDRAGNEEAADRVDQAHIVDLYEHGSNCEE